jgi:hypothetical protein
MMRTSISRGGSGEQGTRQTSQKKPMTADTDVNAIVQPGLRLLGKVRFTQQDASKGVERLLGNMFSLTPKTIISL